jgi:hypothetical protein
MMTRAAGKEIVHAEHAVSPHPYPLIPPYFYNVFIEGANPMPLQYTFRKICLMPGMPALAGYGLHGKANSWICLTCGKDILMPLLKSSGIFFTGTIQNIRYG